MSCEDLVCAGCAHPVAEGRCPRCRAYRDRMHQNAFGELTPVIVSLLLIALLLSLALQHLSGT